ncbi:phospholipid-translocating P-type ATPase [Pyronema domesticum]|nr:phospholipid-translocating P-type ATPase [Pyronema domesticum]
MSYGRALSPSPSDVSSDLDLDLEELDPNSTKKYPPSNRRSILGSDHRSSFSPHRRSSSRRSEEAGAGRGRSPSRIALRNLAMGLGGRGRSARRDDDDQEALLGGRRSSAADDSGNAPLLSRISSRLSMRSGRSTSPEPSINPAFTPSTETRTVALSGRNDGSYPPNIISNHRYTVFTFFPLTLYHEFSFFFNLYFLLVALSQIVPALRIGFLSTYIVPLVFVLTITLGKEAHDDIARRRRDAEANSEPYEVLALGVAASRPASRIRGLGKKKAGTVGTLTDDRENLRTIMKKSRDLKVGDILVLKKDQRVPADVIILKSISADVENGGDPEDGTNGEAFIRTDQLDGETDWKLRMAPALTQALPASKFETFRITASAPSREVNSFVGTLEYPGSGLPGNQDADSMLQQNIPLQYTRSQSVGLSIDNTAWANTVLASNSTTLAAIIYTGPETRAALSTSKGRSKTGLLENEINNLTKILCILTFTLSIVLVALENFGNHPNNPGVKDPDDPNEVRSGAWYVKILRFLILFSSIIPISLRVNLDMGKSAYAYFIEHDKDISGTVVRTSTIPEELGRVEYLLSDKTGTLTQNDMELKKVHVGTVSYAGEAMDEVTEFVKQGFSQANSGTELVTPSTGPAAHSSTTRTRREIGTRVRDVVLALALCHNVTPTTATEEGSTEQTTTYQASSPDEIAIVSWTESVGLRLVHRDRKGMKLMSVDTGEIVVRVKILEVFPFTSEGKRMGIVVQFLQGDTASTSKEQDLLNDDDDEGASSSADDSGDIWFYQKGADTVMSSIVASNDWLDEECGNMAREGLRTLVIGRKRLGKARYNEFSSKYKQASLLLQNRDKSMENVVQEYLENELELLGVTGVEDKLQKDVKPSLELLRNAGIKIWMLTGDKVETARCVAVSAKLVARGQYIHTISKLKRTDLAYDALEFLRNKPDCCLLIDGESLALFLEHFRNDFISLAVQLPAVVACRCTPTQKADVARLIREHTKKRICCIGDGGQASLAADFSVEQFCHLTKLLVWHGRNSYKRSAKLAQFVMHRGLVISVCQTMFSIASRFEPIALYQGWLLVGYATLYTMMPVFSLVLDRDVDERLANLYPELYKELTSGASLSYRTFFIWVLISIYQGSIIQGLSQLLIGLEHFKRMVTVSFTVLVLNELIMVAMEVTTWHMWMVIAEICTLVFFVASVPFLGDYFELEYVLTGDFVWRVAVISAVSLIPPYVVKVAGRRLRPPSYAKVQGI